MDGSGAPGRVADVGIRDERIASIGQSDESAARVIDAAGLVLAPGFIDLHTHYDAQIFWDPSLSPSPLHGVTSVVGGNCGFSIAPLVPEAGDYLMRMLARVEGMPLESLQAGLDWKWKSFGEWLDRLEGQLVVNAGFLVGHSALRCVAMGSAAVGEKASDDQQAAMVRLLHESLEQGGLGFSSSTAQTHHDGDGSPVPSRFATREEILGLCAAVREHPGTTLEFIPGVGDFSDEQIDLMASMSIAAARPLNWNVLLITEQGRQITERQLAASDYAAERGGRVVALTLPQVMTLRLNLRSGMVLDAIPDWAPLFGLPLGERMEALRSPQRRKLLREGVSRAGPFRAIANWSAMTICETFLPANAGLAGRTVGEVASERGTDPFDTFLDVALADELRTSFMPPTFGDDDASWRRRAESWLDPRTVVGASDAGAHLDMIDTFAFSTALVGPAVRERGLISLEQAVHQLTEVPANLYGLRDRGRIAAGAFADLVLFDPDRVGSGPLHTRSDLPAGASRLYAEAEGIAHVFANGTAIVRGKGFTGDRPGRVLRSGRDTDTVDIPAH